MPVLPEAALIYESIILEQIGHWFEEIYPGTQRLCKIQLFEDVFELRFATEALYEAYFPALSHLEIESFTQIDCVYYIADVHSYCPGLSLSDFLDRIIQRMGIPVSHEKHVKKLLFLFPELSFFYGERVRAAFWITPTIIHANICDRTAPFQRLFTCSLAHQKKQVIHAGVVANEDGAVLLAGHQQAGKSTTSMACVRHGLHTLGDNHCIIGRLGVPYVHSLYNAVKVDVQHEELIQPFRKSNTPQQFLVTEFMKKEIIHFSSMKRVAPIKAVFHLSKGNSASPELIPMKSDELTSHIAFSMIEHFTMIQHCYHVSPLQILALVKEILAGIPCYQLRWSFSHEKNAQLICDFLHLVT